MSTTLLEHALKNRRGIMSASQFLRDIEPAGEITDADWRNAYEKASHVLTYTSGAIKSFEKSKGNSLMDFEAVVTSTKQDRDGDILETRGASIDPSAPLLWQHIPMNPIGAFKTITHHSDNELRASFTIAKTDLGRDAATLIEAGALRISHGFEPKKFTPLKNDEGWHITEFSIYEISLVSIPSNTDAVITAYSKQKLHSPLVKNWAKSFHDNRRTQISVPKRIDGEKLMDNHDDFDADKMADLLEAKVLQTLDKLLNEKEKPSAPKRHDGPTAWEVFGEHATKYPQGASDDVNVRVKAAVERYDDTKYPAKREKGIWKGERLQHNGQDLNLPSNREKMMIGTWFKFTTCPRFMTEHEKEVAAHILQNERFVVPGSLEPRRLNPDEQEQFKHRPLHGQKVPLLDDATSGGQEAVPEWFDMHVGVLPVLGSEVAPFVNMIDVPRGSSAESYLMGNPTYTSGATEGTAVTLFDATSFISDLSTSFFRAHGGVEIGKNFLQDSAPNLAMTIVARYGAKAAEWLDEQICNGDGSTEPQGIKNASSTVDITPGTPTTGPLTITDILNLLFGVTKAYRNAYPKQKMAFIMTDETYKDLRSIATGVTGDTRLIFGQDDIFSYRLFDLPVAIEENGMSNNDVIFAQLGGYRLYRRQGVRFVMEDRGQELTTSNSMLIYSDMRYGGQMERGGYAAVMDSAPA